MTTAPPGRLRGTPPLVVLVVGTVALVRGVAADVVHHHWRPHVGIRSALRLNGESNVPAWRNVMLLITGGGLAGLATLQARDHGRPRVEVAGWLAAALTAARSDRCRATASWSGDPSRLRPARMGSAGLRGPADQYHPLSPSHRRSAP